VNQLILHGYDDDSILEHYTLQTSQLTKENIQDCRKSLRPPPRVCRRSEMIRNLLGSTPGVFNKIEGNPLSESKLRSLDQRWKALTVQFDVEHDYVARRVEVPGVLWDPLDKSWHRGTIIKISGKGRFATVVWDDGSLSVKWRISEVRKYTMPYTPTRSSALGPEDWMPRIDRALTTLVDRQLSAQSATRPVPAAHCRW
jgi:hypothetical protein